MAEVRRNIADEMQKIAEGYRSDYEIALTRETSIQKSLDRAIAQSRITNQAQVQLRDFESKAQTSRTMYDNFLQRYLEAVQQQSFALSEARLITPATPPTNKSHPKTLTVLPVSAASGTMVAFGIAVLREASNRVFRTGAQVEGALHLSCLAMLPVFGRHGSCHRCTSLAEVKRKCVHASPLYAIADRPRLHSLIYRTSWLN
jgi:succinoglycan biosynthesis transport protein ExoP